MMRFKDKEGVSYNTKQEVTEEHKPSISLLASGSGLGSGSGSGSGSRQWSSGLKNNPRIVRASRTFGGKDRHSKVCTIKGLRDRRIRLSVPTAIQLYDLQDRLGLNQPSKVIDWLIDSTKDDIDKLPPLPMIPTTFTHHQGYGLPFSSNVISPFFDTNLLSSRKELMGININNSNYENHMENNDGDGGEDEDEDNQSIVAKLKYWDTKQKGLDHNNGHDQGGTSQILAQNLFPIASSTNNSMLSSQNHSQPSFLGNNPMFNYYHLEPSNLSLSQFGNSTQQPSSLSLSSMSQLFQCNSMPSNSSYFPHNHNHNHGLLVNSSSNHHLQVENEMRAFNRFHLSSNSYSSSFQNSSGLEMKPFPLSMNHDEDSRQGKTGQNLWKESSGN
ncbi:unnamed protein product [Amaranthus hypochondriacus]